MRSTVQDEIERLRSQRAAEWLQIMQEGNPDQHAEFVRWITESPLNMSEFLKLDALSRETRAAMGSDSFDRQQLLDRMISPPVPAAHRARWAGVWPWLAAASIAAVAIVGARWAYGEFWGWDRYSAGPSEQRRIELADGSRVYLNAQARLAIRFNASQRELRLSSGEALFDVASDSLRPFRVQTHDAVVEAVGTQFNVDARADGTRVAVIEGKVRISGDAGRATDMGPASAALQAGEAARITPVGAIERDSSVNVAAVTAWSRPELVFNGTPLEQAVEQFNHHGQSKRLRLENVQSGSHHYTGLFDANDAAGFAELLSHEDDLEVEVRDDEIVIRPR